MPAKWRPDPWQIPKTPTCRSRGCASKSKSLMRDRVTPAMADVAGRAEHAAHVAADSVRGQAEMVTSKVREQPLLALLIAAAVGYALGQVTR